MEAGVNAEDAGAATVDDGRRLAAAARPYFAAKGPPWLQREEVVAARALLNEEQAWRAPHAGAPLRAGAEASLVAARREVLLSGGVAVPKRSLDLLPAEFDRSADVFAQAPRVKLYPLGAPTGNFCAPRAEGCARPCCGQRDSAFSELGSGVTAYFKLVKLLATLFALCTLASLPLLAINFWGGNDTVTSLNPIAAFTLGNVGGFNGTSYLALPLVGATRISTSAIIYGAVDVVCVCLFLAAYVWARMFIQREERAVDDSTLTLQDYSLLLHNVAPNTTEEDVRGWVQRVVRHAAARGALGALSAARAVNEAQAAAPEPRLVALDGSTADLLGEAFSVHSVAMVHDHSLLEGALARCGAARARGEAQRGESIATALRLQERPQARPFFEPPTPRARAIARLKERRSEMLADGELDALVAKRLLPAGQLGAAMPAVAAFVSFEHAAACALFLDALPAGALGRACAHAELRLHGAAPRATRAGAPSAVAYANLRFTPLARCARISISTLGALFIIAACFAAIIQVSVVNQSFQRKVTPEDCSSRTLTSFVKFYNTRRTPEDERQLLSAFPYTNPLIYCVCDARGYSSAPAAALGEGDKYLQKCFLQVCPRFEMLQDARATAWPECKQIAQWKDSARVAVVAAGLLIGIVNSILSWAVRALSRFEGHHGSAQQDASVGWRVYVLSVFNSLVLTLLVNMRLGFFPSGLYSEFSPGWYATVGAQFITQIFSQALAPLRSNLLLWSLPQLERRWRDPKLYLVNASRASLAQLLSGPAATDFAVRSADVMTWVTVSFALSSNLPLLYAGATALLTLAFWSDKLLLTRLHRAPAFSGTAVVERMVGFMPFVLIAHICVAIWCVSDMQLFDAAASLPSVDPLRPAGDAPAPTVAPTPAPRRRALAAAALAGSTLCWRALAALAALLGGWTAPAPPAARVTRPLGVHLYAPGGGLGVVGATVFNPLGHTLALRVAAALPGCGRGVASPPPGTQFVHRAAVGSGRALHVGRLEVGGGCNSGACCVVVDCVASAAPFNCPWGVSVVEDATLPLRGALRRLQVTPSPSPTGTATGAGSATPTPTPSASPSASLSRGVTASGSPSSIPTSAGGGGSTVTTYGLSAAGCSCLSACQLDFVGGSTTPSAVCLVGGVRRLHANGSSPANPGAGASALGLPLKHPRAARKLQASPPPSVSASATASYSESSAASPSAPPTATLFWAQPTSAAAVSSSPSTSSPPTGTQYRAPPTPTSFAPSLPTATPLFAPPAPSATSTPFPFFCPVAPLLAKTLGGPVDACALPTFGLTNRGCNCTSPCAASPALSASGRAACVVDVLCPNAFSGGAVPPEWWDFCDAPAPLFAAPISYCELRFFEPACQAANATAPEDLRDLGKFIAAGNYTFSFLGGPFTRTVLAGGAGATSTGRSAALGAAFSPAFAAVDLRRAILTSTIPLTSGLGVTVAVIVASAAALLLGGAARAFPRHCRKQKRAALEGALRGADPHSTGVEGANKGAYAVPLSMALLGAPARSLEGGEMRLVGRSYAIRAQPHVYQALELISALGAAHVELKPEHLAFAEADGVFEDDARGLLFLTPLLWESPRALAVAAARLAGEGGAALPPLRACPEGYKERLRRWVEQQPGSLDQRERDPALWETWVYDKRWDGPFGDGDVGTPPPFTAAPAHGRAVGGEKGFGGAPERIVQPLAEGGSGRNGWGPTPTARRLRGEPAGPHLEAPEPPQLRALGAGGARRGNGRHVSAPPGRQRARAAFSQHGAPALDAPSNPAREPPLAFAPLARSFGTGQLLAPLAPGRGGERAAQSSSAASHFSPPAGVRGLAPTQTRTTLRPRSTAGSPAAPHRPVQRTPQPPAASQYHPPNPLPVTLLPNLDRRSQLAMAPVLDRRSQLPVAPRHAPSLQRDFASPWGSGTVPAGGSGGGHRHDVLGGGASTLVAPSTAPWQAEAPQLHAAYPTATRRTEGSSPHSGHARGEAGAGDVLSSRAFAAAAAMAGALAWGGDTVWGGTNPLYAAALPSLQQPPPAQQLEGGGRSPSSAGPPRADVAAQLLEAHKEHVASSSTIVAAILRQIGGRQ